MTTNLNLLTRNKLFYDEIDFQYETEMFEGYIEEDVNQVVVLYEVDRTKTNVNSVYNEASNGQIRYKPPREIPCVYDLGNAQIRSFDGKSSNGIYTQDGNLTIHVLVRTLEKYGCEIRRGDYIGVMIESNRMKYFTVINDGKVNTATNQMIGLYKPAWRVIDCTPVSDITEFRG